MTTSSPPATRQTTAAPARWAPLPSSAGTPSGVDGDHPALSGQVVLRPVASCLPLGFLAFSLGMVMLAAMGLGWVPASETRMVGIAIAAYVFPLQLMCTIFAFLGRDTASTTTFGLFTTTWLSFGLQDVFAAAGPAPSEQGIFDIAFGVLVAGIALVALPGKPLFSVVLGLAALRAVLDGSFVATGTAVLGTLAGALALAVAATAVYTGFALLLEQTWGREVLPVGRRGVAADAMRGRVADPSGLRAEPGVREQL